MKEMSYFAVHLTNEEAINLFLTRTYIGISRCYKPQPGVNWICTWIDPRSITLIRTTKKWYPQGKLFLIILSFLVKKLPKNEIKSEIYRKLPKN